MVPILEKSPFKGFCDNLPLNVSQTHNNYLSFAILHYLL